MTTRRSSRSGCSVTPWTRRTTPTAILVWPSPRGVRTSRRRCDDPVSQARFQKQQREKARRERAAAKFARKEERREQKAEPTTHLVGRSGRARRRPGGAARALRQGRARARRLPRRQGRPDRATPDHVTLAGDDDFSSPGSSHWHERQAAPAHDRVEHRRRHVRRRRPGRGPRLLHREARLRAALGHPLRRAGRDALAGGGAPRIDRPAGAQPADGRAARVAARSASRRPTCSPSTVG